MALSDQIRDRGRAIMAGCSEQLPEAAEVFANELRVVLNRQGSSHDRSRPGEAPRRQTGRMWNSIVVVPDPRAGIVYVGPTVRYARILLPTRPFYKITADRVRQRMRDLIAEGGRRAAAAPAATGRRSLGSRIASFFGRGR